MTESHAPSRNVMFEGNHKRYSVIMHFANPIIIIKHAFVKKQNPLMGFPSPNLSKFQNVEPNLHSFLLGVHPPLRWQDLLRLRSELSSLDEKARHQTDPKLPPKNDARMKLTDDDLQIVQDILVLKGWSQVPTETFWLARWASEGITFLQFLHHVHRTVSISEKTGKCPSTSFRSPFSQVFRHEAHVLCTSDKRFPGPNVQSVNPVWSVSCTLGSSWTPMGNGIF